MMFESITFLREIAQRRVNLLVDKSAFAPSPVEIFFISFTWVTCETAFRGQKRGPNSAGRGLGALFDITRGRFTAVLSHFLTSGA